MERHYSKIYRELPARKKKKQKQQNITYDEHAHFYGDVDY